MSIPYAIGFIMDGNRRYGREQFNDASRGHEVGRDKFYEVIGWLKEAGVQQATFYAFSTENWKRSPLEVEYIMNIFEVFLGSLLSKNDPTIAFRVIGRITDFSENIQALIKKLEEKNSPEPMVTVVVALSYGGRAEIVHAVNTAVALGTAVDEKTFSDLLWTSGLKDPDLIIRTGGDIRLSNFLPWQSVYSELVFTQTLWPAFTKDEFTRMLQEYGSRERRLGA